MFKAGIFNDSQVPYHDPKALSVAVQIFADAKLDVLVYNGDFADLRSLSKYVIVNHRQELIADMREELERVRTKLKEVHKAIKPKRAKWNDGNHEYRVFRTLTDERNSRIAKLLDIDEIREAIGIPALLGLNALKIEYSGPYPNGCWLTDAEPHDNVWVEHGYSVRKKTGYTVSNLMEDRWASCVVGHCEKFGGPLWRRHLGRLYFGIENGNLSRIGEPEGAGIYMGVPHSVPQYMNHAQGICLIYRDGKDWFPVPVKITNGKALFNGKLYRA